MIKWTFFFNEGNLAATVSTEEEDLRILNSLDSTGILEIPNEKYDLYVNLALVKCTAREVVDDQPSATDSQVPLQNQES